ncbi:MAG: hypothetical protein EOP04_02255 [Proteobacteria bacterium]|nr:MAG: hypothetical protein EOP04_02255 [Pseudomonadota bacterium]
MDVILPESLPLPLPAAASWGEAEKILASFFMNARSPLTAREYRLAAGELFRFLGSEITGPEDLRRHHVIAYRKSLELRGLANKTILKKLSGISSLCKFLAEAGLIERDLTYGISRPRAENRRETAAIDDKDVAKILESIKPRHYVEASHRAILSVGFFTGLRSNEIRQLKIGDIGAVTGIKILRLKIKGDKTHEIPLHPTVLMALEAHLEVLRTRGFPVDDPKHVLFPSLKTARNVPMSDEAIRYIFNSAITRAGIKKDSFRRYSPHSTRATFTTHLLDTAEVPLEHVQAALGHASPETTQSYNKRKRGHDKSAVWKIEF